jgi:DNA-directed RNA polymerase specialized sigma24 family protein
MTYWQYRQMVAMWGMGRNTFDIAKTLNLKESEVANRIASHLKHMKTKVAA